MGQEHFCLDCFVQQEPPLAAVLAGTWEVTFGTQNLLPRHPIPHLQMQH